MKIYLVGGAVRDKLLGLPVKERDYVVVGADENEMLKLGYQQVGKEFPVFLHPKTREEYALARAERKTGPGYKGFAFDASKSVTLEEDLKRRDLTINAMAETADGELIDPYHGKQDLQDKILRHVSEAFAEDPVRILRVGRFLARYACLGFNIAPETNALMKQMVNAGEVNALVAERVWKELERALEEKNPEKFFEVLENCGAFTVLFPEFGEQQQGLNALTAACALSNDTTVRFAALLYASTDTDALCKRFRSPNHYQQLAKMVHRFYPAAFAAKASSNEEILNLFMKLDIFRRADRFESFLQSCQAIANVLSEKSYDADWLRACANAARSFPPQTLVDQGLNGGELAEQLKIKRQEKIAEWRRISP